MLILEKFSDYDINYIIFVYFLYLKFRYQNERYTFQKLIYI